MKTNVNKVLIEMKIIPNLRGYRYILDALDILQEEPELKCGSLYHSIGKMHGVKDGSVERCIRHAIQFADKESAAWKKYITLEKCANAQFLHLLIENLRLEEENGNQN